MTQNELKQKLYELVHAYFGSATITWGKVRAVSPNIPQVVLNMGSVVRAYQPITTRVNGIAINTYPSQTTLQVDLYTKGSPTNATPGTTAAFENTAVNDMIDFMNFLNSAFVDNWSGQHDVSVLANSVNDLTEIINDTSWDYRAMVELEIGFTQTAVGYGATMYEGGVPFYENGKPKFDNEGYALDENGERVLDDEGNPTRLPLDDEGNPILPEASSTSSGGRTQDLADQSQGWFEQVETSKEQEE